MTSQTDSKNRLLGWSRRIGDVGLGAAVVLVVIMMVVPLTPTLIDLLIGINLGFSALLLSLSLFMTRPLTFTSFPTLLLIATLYRLALNVSSTRLILLRANAGQIIRAFGGYVVGGDILVGAVIFGILSMVLFLVITKGAERVAEVSARFSLDALPGMQLAVDSDLRSGAISPTEASRRRASLDETSRYFGALDGAMKFVRGDAIASLIIVAVNIIGGLAVGMIRRGMDIGTALNTYGRLTVGDGLVSMLPALLVSTAAGLLVTRVGKSDSGTHLGGEINKHLRSEPRALIAAAVLMFLLAWMPGLPAWPFLLLAVIFGATALHRLNRERDHGPASADDGDDEDPPSSDAADILVEIAPRKRRNTAASPSSRHVLRNLARGLEAAIARELGLIGIRVLAVESDAVAEKDVVLTIKRSLRVPLSVDDANLLDGSVSAALVAAVWKHAKHLVGMDETQRLLDMISRTHPATVRESVPKCISLPALSALLSKLVKDGIPLVLLPQILETVARVGTTIPPADLRERVRESLAPFFTQRARLSRDTISAYILGQDIQSVLEASLTPAADEPRFAMSREDFALILKAVRDTVHETPAVILAPPHLRAPFANLIDAEMDDVLVLKSAELSPRAELHILGTVTV